MTHGASCAGFPENALRVVRTSHHADHSRWDVHECWRCGSTEEQPHASTHKLLKVDITSPYGLTVYRVHCQCGWKSALVSSTERASESWGWHSTEGEPRCQRWGAECLKHEGHVGRCMTVDGDPIAAIGRQYLGRAV